MARRLIDRNRKREARRQVILLDRLTRQFRGAVERELADAMRDMVDHWEHTREVVMPRGFLDRIEALYARMTEAAIAAFSQRIMQQGKHLGLVLEHKLDFAEVMRRRALKYIQQEAIRRRIQNVTETTRRQIVNAVDAGYREGATLPEVASSVRAIIPRLAQWRADMIARTETHGAANYGSQEAAGALGLPLRKEWLAAHDERTRPSHADADGDKIGMDERFQVGESYLEYPGDPAGDPEEVINCFAPWSLVHMGGLQAAMFREYSGQLIEVSVGGPVNLTVTPNHPVLTERGWVAANLLKEGDNLIQCAAIDDMGARVNPDECHGYATAKQLYRLAETLCRSKRPVDVVVDLHGEMIPGENVDIVPLKGDLLAACDAARLQELENFSLPETDIPLGFFLARRMIGLSVAVPAQYADGCMSGSGPIPALFRGEEAGGLGIAFAHARQRDIQILEAAIDGCTGYADLGCNPVDRVSGLNEPQHIGVIAGTRLNKLVPHGFRCELAPVISIRRFHYSGPVFNFESRNGLLLNDGIISHNCRCTLGYIVDDGIT